VASAKASVQRQQCATASDVKMIVCTRIACSLARNPYCLMKQPDV
jgi:hypothetical protein